MPELEHRPSQRCRHNTLSFSRCVTRHGIKTRSQPVCCLWYHGEPHESWRPSTIAWACTDFAAVIIWVSETFRLTFRFVSAIIKNFTALSNVTRPLDREETMTGRCELALTRCQKRRCLEIYGSVHSSIRRLESCRARRFDQDQTSCRPQSSSSVGHCPEKVPRELVDNVHDQLVSNIIAANKDTVKSQDLSPEIKRSNLNSRNFFDTSRKPTSTSGQHCLILDVT